MRTSLKDLPSLLEMRPEIKLGCIVDTNTLFAASMPMDRLNEWAESVFHQFHALGISPFSNINIRSEFMDLQRRVLIPEGLATLYNCSNKSSMNAELKAQLKSLKTSMEEATLTGKLYKFNDQQMKKYRSLLINLSDPSGLNAWDAFCKSYLHQFILPVWDEAIENLRIQFIGTRAIENREYFERDPNWKDMTGIIGRFGIGSSDAMIINFFLCSRLLVIVTGDEQVAYAVERMSDQKKIILVPNEIANRNPDMTKVPF